MDRINEKIENEEFKIKLTPDDKPSTTDKRNPYLHDRGDGTNEVKLNEVMSGMASGMSQMVSSMEQLGIDLPAGIQQAIGAIQGVSSILTGISTTVLAIEAIAGADALIPFARGGIVPHAANGYFVPGNNFSGDVTPIMANAGELILNKSSQNNLASFIQEAEGRGRSGNGLARVSGEQIWIALNAYTKRTGQGEIVTWKD